jgi:FlaA1/EpsC-like NDP-sugar epimerase
VRRLYLLLVPYRRLFNVVIHLGLIAASCHAAFWLRFDGEVPPDTAAVRDQMLPLLLVIRTIVFIPFRLFEGLWRYTSTWDMYRIIQAVALSSVLFYGLVHYALDQLLFPRSVYIMDAVLLICLMAAVRVGRRIAREFGSVTGGPKVLVYGAGDAGELVVRDFRNLRSRGTSAAEVVGLLDDDRHKIGQRIHGLPVLGSRADIARIVASHEPTEVVIAMPSADAAVLRDIVRALEPFHLRIRMVPQLVGQRRPTEMIRDLAVEDLLSRVPVDMDASAVRYLIAGRRVLVTGAGGSIGSELCRQVARHEPAALVALDRYENGLFDLLNGLTAENLRGRVHGVIADVTDRARIDAVFTRYRPEIVFHAAAHKHVPLMEMNPCEAVKNNVMGTRFLVQAADAHSVSQFILISTDKAVNPTSVMGATKRVAETITRAVQEKSATVFSVVRFGNVLGSNGSVVPLFLDQIRRGGPVTVTHPEMRRFFMLIPEAVQLVLHAASLREKGCAYVLEMGDQIKLVDLARDLIRLSGSIPDVEIPIKFVGMRAGEKLYEELVATDEAAEPSPVNKIRRLRVPPPLATPNASIADLEEQALAGRDAEVIRLLQLIVPTFTPTAAGGPLPSTTATTPTP